MNFEQLLDGANDPNPFKASMIWGLAQNRLSPDVMREVWAALKEGAEPSNWFFDEGAYQMVCRKDVRTRCTRALALLDGQQPTKEEM